MFIPRPKKALRPARRISRELLPKLLSVNQTCDVLGIGRTTFYELLNSKKLSVVKLGRRTLVLAEEIDAFVASLPTGDMPKGVSFPPSDPPSHQQKD